MMFNYRPHGVFKIATNNNELRKIYEEAAEAHNKKVTVAKFPDAGFDLYVPTDVSFSVPFVTQFIDLEIVGVMETYHMVKDVYEPISYYMYPRSSLTKTPLMLGNHTGIIDSGYRGNLKAGFRWLTADGKSYAVRKGTRLLQVCHPTLNPITVVVVDMSELMNDSERGTGGFGSTGV